jgi:hypothetical protein
MGQRDGNVDRKVASGGSGIPEEENAISDARFGVKLH